MEQPIHDLRPMSAAQATPRRIGSVIVVGLLHVVIIWALATGLASQLFHKQIEDLKTEVIKDKPPEQNKVPPPPPPEMVKPPPPFVPPPDITVNVETPNTNAITQVTTQHVEPKPSISSPAAIGRPHTCPNSKWYPALAMRLNHEGTTLLAFTVNTDGTISNISVAQSSGHDELDQAAMSCAQDWSSYKPAQQNGAPVAVPWKAKVVWRLTGG